MGTISMNKAIHGAVRRDLDRFSRALETFPAGDAARAAQLATAWDNLDAQLTDHHQGEHAIAWPHLERAGVSRQILDEMDAEHHVMAAALERARTAVHDLRDDPSAPRVDAAADAVRQLRTATVAHLEHEEAELEEFFVANEDHPELQAMAREFRRRSPSFAGRFFSWVTDGATTEETAAVRSHMPGPVFALLTRVWGRGYRKDIAPLWRDAS
jgi:hypothetical protein